MSAGAILTACNHRPTIALVRALLSRLGRGFAFGFSAAVGAWVAIVLLSLLVVWLLRPWG
jgi:hypothetical protein